MTRNSLMSAMTAIGSVALISAPKTSADSSGQPSRATSPPATTAAQSATPIVDSAIDRNEIAPQIAPAQVERRLEQERRQDDVEDEVVGQRETGVAARGGERRARKHEADRIGQAQTARRERDENRKAKQAQRAKQQNVHASCLTARLGKRNCAAALFRRGEIGAGAQIALGIDRLAVDAHFIVQMRAGRAAGRTEPA